MRNKFSGAVAMLVGATLLVGWVFPGQVRGYQPFVTTANTPFTWNLAAQPGGTIQWQVGDGAPPMLHDSMVSCTQAWVDATGGVLKFAEGPGGILVDWDSKGTMIADPTFLAYTTFNTDAANHISSAHMIVNASNYTWQRGGFGGVGNPGPDGKRQANLDSVVLHELGHALGLDHSDKSPAAIVGGETQADPPTMNSVIYPNAGTLHADDIAGIRALYTGGAAAAEAASPLTLSATPAIGKAPLGVSLTQSGGDATTNWDFGDGSSGSGFTASHRFAAPGTYTVTATFGTSSATMTIQVLKKGQKAPKTAKVKKPKAAKKK